MSSASNIEWTDATWNPVVGCSIVSPGCTNCYAMKMAARIEAMSDAVSQKIERAPSQYDGLTKKVNGNVVWTGDVRQAPESILLAPLRWRKPRRIFVNSMGDLFHEDIPDQWIDRVFAVMALSPQHTFQVLTKRAERMRDYCSELSSRAVEIAQRAVWLGIWDDPDAAAVDTVNAIDDGPLPNVWLGISAERQQEADERIPLLLQTPAAIRFVSLEPLLGAIDLERVAYDRPRPLVLNALSGWIGFDERGNTKWGNRLNWIIVGGESGRNARPMHPDWARDLRDQCQNAGVPFFFKQWGEHAPRWPGDRSDGMAMERVGKKRAGRLLDGCEHSEFPSTVSTKRDAA